MMTPKVTQSERAGLIFPVSRFRKMITPHANRCKKEAAVAVAAALEHFALEVIETSVAEMHNSKQKRLMPIHIAKALKHDSELNAALEGSHIMKGGVLPAVHV